MPNYRIVESVGSGTQSVNKWSDIEHHHPSDHLHEAGRVYAKINGKSEEVAGNYAGTAVYTPGGQLMVSKDIILQNTSNNSFNTPVPSPANGYIGEVDKRNGTVTILDRPGGEVMFQLRHMKIGENIQPGTKVEYGQPLGIQSGYGKGDPNFYGTHLHIDANVKYLDQAARYVSDIATGKITTDHHPTNTQNLVNAVPKIEHISGTFPTPPRQALADGKIEFGEKGPDVAILQEKLKAAGARDAQGREIKQDGDFGNGTKQALENYQKSHNLPSTGVADRQTLTQLGVIGNQQQTPTQSSPAQPVPAQTPQSSSTPAPDANANKTFLQKQSPETRAYLDLVAWKEVGQSLNADGSPAGYRERNGVPGSKGLMPESAIADNGTFPRDELRYNVGRYQMKQVDVDDMRARYDKKIDDFSPESQDRIAVAKMQYRGVTEALDNGDIRSAIKKGGQEWASLPGSPYGQVQSGYTADQAVEYYNKRLAFHQAQDRGQTTPTQGETRPTQGQSGSVSDTLLVKEERGEGVKHLQEALNKAGIRDAAGQPLPTTGYYGDMTEAAVRKYQEQKGLEVDGKAGKDTLSALGIYPGQQQATQADKPQTPANAAPTAQTDKPQAAPTNTDAQHPTPTDKPQTPANTNTAPAAQTDKPQAAPTNTDPQQPTQTDKPLISNPNHPDNKLYQQAVSNLEQLGPSGGFKSREELEKAAAAVAVDAKATGLQNIDHISKTTAPNGQSYLVAVQGDPTSPAAKNSYIDYGQAVNQTVAQSTSMAEAQKPAVQMAQQTEQPQQEQNKVAVGGR